MKKIFIMMFALLFLACGSADYTEAQQVGVGQGNVVTLHGHSGSTDGGTLNVFDGIYSHTNTALVTLTTSYLEVNSIDLGSVTAGDAILCNANVQVAQSTTAGSISILNGQSSGTAVVAGINGTAGQVARFYQAASTTTNTPLFSVYTVTTSGTLTISNSAVEVGAGSATVTVGTSFLKCWFMKKQ